MKNIMKVALLMLLAGSIASCNLDKYPDGDAIPEEQAFTTFKDAGQFRLSLYYFARQCFSSYTVIPVNMQAEGINATLDYGNQMGFQYTWTFADNDSYVEQLWTYCYGGIYQINYFIQKANEAGTRADLTQADGVLHTSAKERVFRSRIRNRGHCSRVRRADRP